MYLTQFDHVRFYPLPLVIWSRVFWPLTQSTALEQKRLDLRSLSSALRNLWLIILYIPSFLVFLSYFLYFYFLLYLVLNTHFINCIICKYAIQSSGYKKLVIYRSIYLSISYLVKLYSNNVFKRLIIVYHAITVTNVN